MVSLRVKRTLGHTKTGLLWGFNLKFSSSIPAAPFIGKSPRACLFLVAFDWPYSWIELHCVVPENIHTHPLPPPPQRAKEIPRLLRACPQEKREKIGTDFYKLQKQSQSVVIFYQKAMSIYMYLLPHGFMPHHIEVDWWAEVLSDSNCCVQVDDHVPPAARNKHCFTRTVKNLKLQWEQKWKHATLRDKISYGWATPSLP